MNIKGLIFEHVMHPNTNIGISKRKAIWNSQHFCQIRFGFCAFLKRILKAYDGCCKSLREFAHLSEISNKQTNVGSFVVKHTNYFLKYMKQSKSLFKTDSFYYEISNEGKNQENIQQWLRSFCDVLWSIILRMIFLIF